MGGLYYPRQWCFAYVLHRLLERQGPKQELSAEMLSRYSVGCVVSSLCICTCIYIYICMYIYVCIYIYRYIYPSLPSQKTKLRANSTNKTPSWWARRQSCPRVSSQRASFSPWLLPNGVASLFGEGERRETDCACCTKLYRGLSDGPRCSVWCSQLCDANRCGHCHRSKDPRPDP